MVKRRGTPDLPRFEVGGAQIERQVLAVRTALESLLRVRTHLGIVGARVRDLDQLSRAWSRWRSAALDI